MSNITRRPTWHQPPLFHTRYDLVSASIQVHLDGGLNRAECWLSLHETGYPERIISCRSAWIPNVLQPDQSNELLQDLLREARGHLNPFTT